MLTSAVSPGGKNDVRYRRDKQTHCARTSLAAHDPGCVKTPAPDYDSSRDSGRGNR
jgi:hypothetical protein